MDIRIDIIEAVKDALQDRVDEETLAIVQDTLIIELNKYEVQERCTEVAVSDRSAEGQLRKYLATNGLKDWRRKRWSGTPTKTRN